MADLRITNLPAMAAGTAQTSDVLPVSDVSASTTKKITIGDLIKDGIDALPDASIDGDKVNFTLANGSVGTAELKNGSVTGIKLADGSAAGTGASLPSSGDYVGQLFFKTSAPKQLHSWNGSTWDAVSGLIAVDGDTTGLVNTYVSTSGGTATVSADIDPTTGPGEFLAGPAGGPGAIVHRRIASQDLPTAGTAKGAVAVNGNGLKMSGDVLSLSKGISAQSSGQLVTYDDQGLVVSGNTIQSSDLPLATDSSVGAVTPGTGLSVGLDGALNHTNSVVSGTAPKITFDTEGHVTQGEALLPADIPDLGADKITSGQFGTPYIADESITLPKLADYSIAYIQEASPSTLDPGHIGVLWYQESTAQLRMWNGNSFRPIGFGRLSQDNLRWGGTVDAATNAIEGVTEAGTTAGLKIGDPVPNASNQLGGLYLVVSVGGSGINETPGITYDAGDWCLCVNATEGWIRINTLSSGGGGGGSSSLGDLLDVTLTAATAGEFIQLQDNGQWQNIEVNPSTIGALKPGDNVSELVNDANYLADGDNISRLNNDAGYVTGSTAPVLSVNTKTGNVVLTAADIGALAAGDNVSELVNDAGYLTSATLPPGSALWSGGSGKIYPTTLTDVVGIGTSNPSRSLDVLKTGDNAIIRINNSGDGNRSAIEFFRETSAGTDKGGAAIWVNSDTSSSQGVLNFAASSDAGVASMTPDMVLDGSGRLGIGVASPSEQLHVKSSGVIPTVIESTDSRSQINFRNSGGSTTYIGSDGGDFKILTNGTERARVDYLGRLQVGADTGYPVGTGLVPRLLVQGSIPAAFVSTRDDAIGAIISLAKGKSPANIDTPVELGDILGEIRFAGYDGTDFVSYGASIKSIVDGTPGTDDMPGRLSFSTTSAGSASSSERLRIDSDGDVFIGGVIPSAPNITLNASGSASFEGPVGVGTDSADADLHVKNNNATIYVDDPASQNPLQITQAGGKAEIVNVANGGTVLGNANDGDISFVTGFAKNVRMCILNNGNVGIATSTPTNGRFVVNGPPAEGVPAINIENYNSEAATTSDITLTNNAVISSQFNLNLHSVSGSFTFNKSGGNRTGLSGTAELARIDSEGRLLLGTDNAIATTGGVNAQSQLHSSTSGLTQSIVSWSSAGSDPSRLVLGKSIGGAVGTRKLVEDQNVTGLIRIQADNGTEFLDQAWIRVRVDGAPTGTSIPGRLEFHTTKLGDSGPTERMRIDNEGRVGFNGTAANARVYFGGNTEYSTLAGAIGYQNAATISSNTTGTYQAFNAFNRVLSTTSLGSYIAFGANFNEIQTGGSLTNLYGFKAESGITVATNNYGFYSNLASGTGRWNFYANGDADNYFAGNVGIGTDSPAEKLHIFGASGNTTQIIQSGGVVGRLLTNASGTYVGTTTDHDFTIQSNSQARVTVKNTGTVGIGTDSPATDLHVKGTAATVQIVESTNNQCLTHIINSATNLFYVGTTGENWNVQTNATQRLSVTSTGNVGVGLDSPEEKLHVNGRIRATGFDLESLSYLP